MVIPAHVPSLKVPFRLGCSHPQVQGTGPGIAETASPQKNAMQSCQLFHLPVQIRNFAKTISQLICQ